MAKHLVGKINEIDRKGSRTVRIQDVDIALFKLSDEEVLAVENKCPHKGGALSEGMVCGKVVHCPLHDWKIDLYSGKAQEPDDGCVTTFAVEVDPVNGSIFITM
ncbi:nitrite reductase small subunit NirD [Cohnella lupini]|uniref:Nitrite reductase (NADH) small subunit n=1 Tax=Cohnella lupini TaxID=1294267 RepID=A0A3D9IVQ0_9BACL|nr:nitrite reductase small subunit NirD [Cohnella lupini]RED65755.1 nitrite reductase (NADH) small subunit [Cohnella lupini]